MLFPVYAEALTLSGFDKPESMQVDPDTGSYYVSNVNGDPLVKDRNGYISKITANGNTVIQKFIGGKPGHSLLNAPKGLWISGRRLFVADIDSVKVFDKETGKLTATVDLMPWNAKFLNELTMDSSGALYVSDRLTSRIFKIDPETNYEVSVFREGPILGRPNGLMINPKTKQLVVVTWDNGEILEIDHNGNVHVLKRGLKGLHGIDYDVEGNLYVSNFEKGEIYRIPFYGRGSLTTFMSGLTTPAGISCDRKKHDLLVPSFKGNSVTTFPLILRPEKNKDGFLGKGNKSVGENTE
jgi:DNA-binding beta-propeller fold protein YncE